MFGVIASFAFANRTDFGRANQFTFLFNRRPPFEATGDSKVNGRAARSTATITLRPLIAS